MSETDPEAAQNLPTPASLPNKPHPPWAEEEDCYMWEDVASGLTCLILRDLQRATLNGYVAVPYGHPAWGLSIASLHLSAKTLYGLSAEGVVCVGPETMFLDNPCLGPLPQSTLNCWWIGLKSIPLRVDDASYGGVPSLRGRCLEMADTLHQMQAQEIERGRVPENLSL